jgi:hypothetical protein
MKKDQVIKLVESSVISLAASFPVFASIATGWSEYKNHLQAENIKFIIDIFSKKLIELEEKIDNKFINSDEFKGLIIQTSMYGKDEITTEKKKYLAYFLANSCTREYADNSIKITVLETIKKLSSFDLAVLKIIGESTLENWTRMKKYNPSNSSWTVINEKNILDHYPKQDELNIISTLEYLNVTGVIELPSSRQHFISLDSQIQESNIYNELNEKYYRESELRGSESLSHESFKELEKLGKEIESLSNKLEESRELSSKSNDHNKYYSISALGVKILDFLK